MGIERANNDPDPNWESARHEYRRRAVDDIRGAKNALDLSMRGTRGQVTRTLLSTAYDLLKQVEPLLQIVQDMDPDYQPRTTSYLNHMYVPGADHHGCAHVSPKAHIGSATVGYPTRCGHPKSAHMKGSDDAGNQEAVQ